MGTFMSKHSNLLKYMPVDDKASALNMKGDLDKDGKMSGYEAKRQAAIDKNMSVDDEASALNHNSFPVHEHPHSVKGKSYTKEIKDLPSYTKEIKDLPKKGNITKNKKPIDGSKDVVKL